MTSKKIDILFFEGIRNEKKGKTEPELGSFGISNVWRREARQIQNGRIAHVVGARLGLLGCPMAVAAASCFFASWCEAMCAWDCIDE